MIKVTPPGRKQITSSKEMGNAALKSRLHINPILVSFVLVVFLLSCYTGKDKPKIVDVIGPGSSLIGLYCVGYRASLNRLVSNTYTAGDVLHAHYE